MNIFSVKICMDLACDSTFEVYCVIILILNHPVSVGIRSIFYLSKIVAVQLKIELFNFISKIRNIALPTIIISMFCKLKKLSFTNIGR